jgi:hypothetical protein
VSVHRSSVAITLVTDKQRELLQMRMIVLACLLLLTPATALAYFDPGTSSLLVQGLVAVIASVSVFWGHVKAFFHSLFSNSTDTAASADAVPGVKDHEHDSVETHTQNQH